MKVMVDTNILVDIALARQPFAKSSIETWTRIAELGDPPFFAPHSLATFYYLVKQAHDNTRAIQAVDDLLLTGQTADFPAEAMTAARELAFSDFEDAMVVSAAIYNNCDRLVTRNPKDFDASPLPVQTPDDFLSGLDGS